MRVQPGGASRPNGNPIIRALNVTNTFAKNIGKFIEVDTGAIAVKQETLRQLALLGGQITPLEQQIKAAASGTDRQPLVLKAESLKEFCVSETQDVQTAPGNGPTNGGFEAGDGTPVYSAEQREKG
jgi:hypothetical protein